MSDHSKSFQDFNELLKKSGIKSAAHFLEQHQVINRICILNEKMPTTRVLQKNVEQWYRDGNNKPDYVLDIIVFIDRTAHLDVAIEYLSKLSGVSFLKLKNTIGNDRVRINKLVNDAKQVANLDAQIIKIDEGNYPNVSTLIEYSGAALEAWTAAHTLPIKYQKVFLDTLENNPKLDPNQLLEKAKSDFTKSNYKQRNPYDNDEANIALGKARALGVEAEVEFKRVYDLMGDVIKFDEVINKLKNKFLEVTEESQQLDQVKPREEIKNISSNKELNQLQSRIDAIRKKHP